MWVAPSFFVSIGGRNLKATSTFEHFSKLTKKSDIFSQGMGVKFICGKTNLFSTCYLLFIFVQIVIKTTTYVQPKAPFSFNTLGWFLSLCQFAPWENVWFIKSSPLSLISRRQNVPPKRCKYQLPDSWVFNPPQWVISLWTLEGGCMISGKSVSTRIIQ